ncbi:MAG: nitroreductase [Pseudomonadota bacterium]
MSLGPTDVGRTVNEEVVTFLSTRRSVKAGLLGDPGPSAEELDRILRIGTRVPDHKKLTPWRFIVFQGRARERMGEVFAACCRTESDPDASDMRLATERARFLRAPLVIALISVKVEKPGVPEFEQVLSTGAVGLSVCLAANALGYGSQWLTEWISTSRGVKESLELQETEQIAGFIYIGSALERLADRDRPELDRIVTHWPSQ